MSLYGVRIPVTSDGDLEWFRTDADLQTGRYVLKHHRSTANVFLSETIPGLILEAGSSLRELEDRGQEALASPGISEADRKRLEAEYTQRLLSHLTETSSIWRENPRWVHKLEPA